ncbi:mor transcription activator family protein [Pasteurella multocida]|uniref:Mor transcription activator family protein n=1 Tax=Pasteurella multocida TaxID=747 RepID=UPI0007ED8F05|nr:Mor transcription activator family protein [Pasteurella multocida]MCL7839146.1 mor transcription activator family protein [Pasteurella multocida]MEB3452064.1 Mor transcription activator family protein [Pasteurella multocida]MEB3460491.1 Mor transcription activator family protein [Pasteurella multocida]MEB3462715.1 Mor transcription activator family protein [Pasteurella multocida]OBP35184.1 mor transcription activator family protein [Pasteurella multocida subsp. multocida]
MYEIDLKNVAKHLPDVVHEMINIAGFHNTEKIIKRFGGARFRFTDGAHYFPRLSGLIGEQDAIKLRQHFSSEEVYIPRCDVALRILRNQNLKADFDYLTLKEEKSDKIALLDICYKYQLSERQVREIIASFRRENTSRQESLF